MYLQSFRRYERKYRLTQNQLDSLLPVLLERMEYDEHCPNGKTYDIQDLYFDTAGREIVRGCALELGFKQKLRLRSYLQSGAQASPCFLEYKKKAGKLGGKRRVALSAEEAAAFIQHGTPPQSDGADREIFAEIASFIAGRQMQPAARIQYRRLALFGRENRELRATIDCALRAVVFMPDEPGAVRIPLLESGCFLLEIKIPGAMPLWLSAALNKLELYPQSHSKYGRAWLLARQRQLLRQRQAG